MTTATAPIPYASLAAPAPGLVAPPTRLASIDAYRGFVMFLMMAEVLSLAGVGRATKSPFWQFLGTQQTHVEWVGCSLHDLIQPSFSFLVGVALPFSIAARRGRGQSRLRMTLHAAWRALLLTFLGIFLRSQGFSRTYFTFEDTLSQIGMGYLFLFLLGFRPPRDQWIALGVLLFGYWLAFALYPLPPANFDYAAVDVSQRWLSEHGLHGFAAHWQKNSNLAWRFDTWFLNLFQRPPMRVPGSDTRVVTPFVANGGGYATLSFIPTLATMILGLLAGNVLKSERSPLSKIRWLVTAAAVSLAAGLLLHLTGLCPIVKRIWTPSWTLASGGACFLFLAAFYALLDVARRARPLAFPLLVIGANSIAAYLIAHLWEGFFGDALKRHLPDATFAVFGTAYRSLLFGGAMLLCMWLVLFWMYRRRLFLRI
jgi:heparan-alpha-glucosaminide N-acetyltransferase